jgi:nitric oxide reductase activation protein
VHDTQRQTMRNLYGPYSIVVPRVEELTQQLAPLLRKLLLKAIF